jgi:hypothetical protein
MMIKTVKKVHVLLLVWNTRANAAARIMQYVQMCVHEEEQKKEREK